MHAPAPQQSDIHTSLPQEGTETACAPILLFVYNRPAHVKRTVEALQANYLAAESDLFVYSDAARDDTAHAAVEEVRAYVRGIRGFRSVNVALRKEFDLYANVRPARTIKGVPGRYDNVDLVVVRENTEDLYAGIEHMIGDAAAESIKLITRAGSERIARFAFDYAAKNGRKKESNESFMVSKKKISLLLMRLYEIKKKFGLITETDLIRIARENKINLYELIAKKENKKFKILKREEERARRRKKAKTEKKK